MLAFYLDGEALKYEALSDTSSAVGFTKANFEAPASYAKLPVRAVLITVEVASIYFTVDGTTPTVGGVGHQMTAGQNYVVKGLTSIRNFLCINSSAGSGAVVKCSFFF